MSLPENRAYYICATTYTQEPNVIHLYRLAIDTKIVPMKLPMLNPFTNQKTEICFAGASTRRQGLYRYIEKNYNGSILGG